MKKKTTKKMSKNEAKGKKFIEMVKKSFPGTEGVFLIRFDKKGGTCQFEGSRLQLLMAKQIISEEVAKSMSGGMDIISSILERVAGASKSPKKSKK